MHEISSWLNRTAEEVVREDKQKACHSLRGVRFEMRDCLPVDGA